MPGNFTRLKSNVLHSENPFWIDLSAQEPLYICDKTPVSHSGLSYIIPHSEFYKRVLKGGWQRAQDSMAASPTQPALCMPCTYMNVCSGNVWWMHVSGYQCKMLRTVPVQTCMKQGEWSCCVLICLHRAHFLCSFKNVWINSANMFYSAYSSWKHSRPCETLLCISWELGVLNEVQDSWTELQSGGGQGIQWTLEH